MYVDQILIQPYFHAPETWEWVSVVRADSIAQCDKILARDYGNTDVETRVIEEES